MSDGKVLVIKGGGPCPAHPDEIEYVVARNLNNFYGKNTENTLSMLSLEAKKLSKRQRAIPISVKCNSKLLTVPTGKLTLKLLEKSARLPDVDSSLAVNNVGYPSGMLTAAVSSESPRLPESYLRFGAPMFNVPHDVSIDHLTKSGVPIIIIVPGGGSFYVKANTPVYVSSICYSVAINCNEDIKFYLAWFKSSYFIWHCITVVGDQDLMALMFNRLPCVIPSDEIYNDLKLDIINRVDLILSEEKKLVNKYRKLCDKNASKSAINNEIVRHNKLADTISREIDLFFFKALGLSFEDVEYIYSTLRTLDIHSLHALELTDFTALLKGLDSNVACKY